MRSEFQINPNTASTDECVWMTAGVIDYKLCDRGFDCDSCPFDRTFRDAALCRRTAPNSITDSESYRVAPMLFYHRSHLWARIEDEGVVRVGLDDFGQSLTGRIYAVELPEEGQSVDESRPVWRIAHPGGQTRLTTPITGVVLRKNSRLVVHPSLINRDPYGEGWAFVIRPSHLEECLKRLFYGRRVKQWYGNDVTRLRRAINDASPLSSVGPTMNDGGTHLKDLTSLLTADQLRRIIDSFLSVPVAGTGSAMEEHQGR